MCSGASALYSRVYGSALGTESARIAGRNGGTGGLCGPACCASCDSCARARRVSASQAAESQRPNRTARYGPWSDCGHFVPPDSWSAHRNSMTRWWYTIMAMVERGVTLSWGTGELACREVDATGEKNVAVLGCGAVGLATARLLQERGCAVSIYAKDLPPHTTSNVAGAQWFPVYVSQRGHQAPDFMPRLVEASRLANARYQVMVGPRYGIRWLPNY